MSSYVHYGDEQSSPLLYCSLILVQLMLQLTWEKWHTTFKIFPKEGVFFFFFNEEKQTQLKAELAKALYCGDEK